MNFKGIMSTVNINLKNIIMKNITKFIVVTLMISFTGCTNDDSEKQTYIYKSEKFNLTELINTQSGKMIKTLNKNSESDFIHSEFETTFYIPNDFDKNEIESYILKNQASIDGTIKYLINDNVFIEVEISGGKKINTTNYNYASMFSFLQEDPYPKKDECSYDGIQDCVQFAVYEEWTTVEAIICAATGGLNCIATEAAACIETNCS